MTVRGKEIQMEMVFVILLTTVLLLPMQTRQTRMVMELVMFVIMRLQLLTRIN